MSDDLEAHRLSKANPTWSPIKLKFLCSLVGGGTPSKDREDFWTGGDVPWVSPKDMKVRDITDTEDHITLEAVAQSATSFVPSGAPIIVARSGILRHTIPVAISRTLVTLNQDMKAFRVSSKLDPEFLAFWIEGQSKDLLLEWRQFGATVESLDTFRLLNGRLALPDLPTQKRIAAFLDRETARIDDLIAKKERLMQGFGPRLEALVADALTDSSLPKVRFEHISQAVSRPCNLSEHDELVRLGLFNRGRGIFKKPAADEEGMGDSTFYFIEDGDLILSGQFAWEGAVAMAGKEEAGCVVSHRYPVYRGTRVKTSYLLAFFRSRYGDFVLNDASRGAAGRNRPLNTRRLGKEKIPVPSDGLQEQIEHTISAEARLRAVHFKSVDRLREYRAALITAAVTGQIDVETYGKSGTPSATLDQIEEEMQG